MLDTHAARHKAGHQMASLVMAVQSCGAASNLFIGVTAALIGHKECVTSSLSIKQIPLLRFS